MAQLILNKDEYTVESLVEKMSQDHGAKSGGQIFSAGDIHDWATKKRIPKRYGGQYIASGKIGPLKIIKLSTEPFAKEQEKFEVEIINLEE